jgi:hypothetical protein
VQQEVTTWAQLEKAGRALQRQRRSRRVDTADSPVAATADPRGLTMEELEFGRNLAASSKDNFVAWMAEQLEECHARFNWSNEELETIMGLLLVSRDMAINDVDAVLAECL